MKKEIHPCLYHADGKCTVFKQWWDGRPSECGYAPDQLRLSGEDRCSTFPGEFTSLDGTRIHPAYLSSLRNIARFTK